MASQQEYLQYTTKYGKILVKLATADAPQSCAAIKKLVEGGYYNDCVLYRAEPKFVIQGGLTQTNGSKVDHPVKSIPLEVRRLNKRGAVTLARWEDPSSATGEFFIVLKDSPHLDRSGESGWALGFAVFGEVVEGMEVADAISALPTQVKGGLKMLVEPIVFDVKLLKY